MNFLRMKISWVSFKIGFYLLDSFGLVCELLMPHFLLLIILLLLKYVHYSVNCAYIFFTLIRAMNLLLGISQLICLVIHFLLLIQEFICWQQTHFLTFVIHLSELLQTIARVLLCWWSCFTGSSAARDERWI